MGHFLLACPGPHRHKATSARDTFGGWHGIIIARALPGDFPEAEYRRIMAGGTVARERTPDGYSAQGVPQYRLHDYLTAQAARDLDRLCLDRVEYANTACNAGRTVMLNFIGATASLNGVQYFAVGTGTPTAPQTGPQSTDTQLFTEVFRKAPTSYTSSGNQQIINTFFGTTDGNFTYTEAGLFGNNATITANSGALFAHANYVYAKNSSITLSNSYVITLS